MSEIKNIPASVSERLKNIAKESGKAFDQYEQHARNEA
jgi:hypothetical protein